MFNDDTIAAISTPMGYGGIGIVRLSGKAAIEIADKLFQSPKKKSLKHSPTNRVLYGHIVNPSNKEVIDEVLVSVIKAPYTYTKEDVVEINCHGGPISLRRVLELVLKYGARLAEAGEFTMRAFLNGRIDLTQAEAVLDVINAMTEQSQKAAIEQLKGGLSRKIETMHEELLRLAVSIEAYIDFPEEDIEPLSLRDMRKEALKIQQSLKKLIDASQYGLILREGLKTAIVGRPNVGKSSLLNALLEKDRSIVTEIPGTTRDVIEDYLNIHGMPVKVMDTAGIRKVEDIAEKEGVRRSLITMENADLILIVLDGSEELNDTDRELIEKSDPEKTILVINKRDIPQKIKLIPSLVKGGNFQIVNVSALKGSGLDELKEKIVETALRGKSISNGIVTNVRHVNALRKALTSVDNFIEEITRNTPPEFLSVELRDAIDAIGEIIGITTSEDILKRIFSNFCIGK